MNLAQNITNNGHVYLDSWLKTRNTLKSKYGETNFKSWLGHLDFIAVEGSELVLAAPTRFIREWIVSNFADGIKTAYATEQKNVKSVSILARPKNTEALKSITANENNKSVDINGQNVDASAVNREDKVSSPIDRRYTFDNYVTGEANKLAYASASAIAENNNFISGSLFLYGGVGRGKTHLMHAVANYVREHNPARKVAYLSAEKFMYHFVQALRNKDVMSFKEVFRGVDVLMIDDIQFICGKASTQEEFFHTFNALIDSGKQVVISSNVSPYDLEGLNESIRSRLSGGMVADIGIADYELRLGILKSKVHLMGKVEIPHDVLEFLSSNVTSNIRELEGALNKVIAHSTLMGNKITLKTTQNILSDILKANEKVLTINDIQKKVADFYSLKISDMTSTSRLRSIARPRQVAMYLTKALTSRSLSEIGRKFGGKDHTTVIHAVKKIEELLANDNEFREEVETLERALRQ